ncbi:MAG: cytidine deaminase [Bacilli bacterium]|nr:cytidine deaminase [Bacilli bacterium]
MEKNELVTKAIEARELSYSPYSKFKVGAAVLTTDGKVFLGANIENSAYPLCMCAERNALYNAYMHGVKKGDIAALALAADTEGPCAPCGACRQVMSELMPKSAPIFMANLKGLVQETSIDELLPFAFSEDDLK